MDKKYPVGQVGGIPIVLDQTFILLVLLFGFGYFKTGRPEMILAGIVIAAGGIASILVHELAHAWAGRICGIGSTHIELNGLGGLCHLERAPHSREQDTFILLAGPASNLALWALCHWLAHWGGVGVFSFLIDHSEGPGGATNGGPAFQIALQCVYILNAIGTLNIAMFVLNLMPSFPLDGGRALANQLANRLGPTVAKNFVAHLGCLVCLGLVWYGLKHSTFALVIAWSLFIANKQVMDTHDRPPWKRWN